jgi:hypothetical protein
LQRAETFARLDEPHNARERFLLGQRLVLAPMRLTAGWLSHSDDADTEAVADNTLDSQSQMPVTFIERLYRNRNSYADRLSPEELSWIHIDLGLESYLLSAIQDRKQVIVTGNPGDGKTHLIEKLRPELEATGALVMTDANALSDQEILDAWQQCARDRRPMVLAINEWPLFVLFRIARDKAFEPVGEAVRQVQEAVYYLPPEPAPAQLDVAVIDLRTERRCDIPASRSVSSDCLTESPGAAATLRCGN